MFSSYAVGSHVFFAIQELNMTLQQKRLRRDESFEEAQKK